MLGLLVWSVILLFWLERTRKRKQACAAVATAKSQSNAVSPLNRRGTVMDERKVTIQLISEFLDARKWNYCVTEDGRIESGFQGKSARFPVRLALYEKPVLNLVVVVDLPFIVPEERRAQVAEAIVRANYSRCPSRFDMDMSDGSIHCFAVVAIGDGTLTPAQFDAVFGSALSLADRYFRAFARLLYGDDLSPAEVIAEVEMAKQAG
jgi:hypothetical protein